MGGKLGKKKTKFPPSDDPFYQMGPPGAYGAPPPYPYPPRYGPGGRYGDDPYDAYGYGPKYPPTDSFDDLYGGPMQGRGCMGGPFGRGMSPWNYGNYYMGNTSLQMIPFMQKTLSKISQLQAILGMGGGMMPMMPGLPSSCCMPCPPSSCCMPMCSPSSCCMPMCSPMMAAATPLPITCNPLIQSMCPMPPTNCCNWMSPSSFMSALSSGPMACRPPASFQFPSNVGMVMPFPWGTPNPLLTPSSFGGFSPQYNGNGGLSCCCYYCIPPPPPPPPPITYYPRPVCVPQPYPVPCPAPVPIPNVQQIPVPRCVSVVAPPIVADCNPCCPVPAGAPLIPSQGVVTLGTLGQSLVMRSNTISTDQRLFNDETRRKPIRKTFDQSRRAKAERIAASLSNLGLGNTILDRNNSLNEFKYRIKSTRNVPIRSRKDFSLVSKSNDEYISDSNLTTLDTLFSLSNKSKQKQNNKSKHYSHSNRHRN
ncbi:unnamed protein product [Rotaria sordida]|uniref:Uncharacterized protein n=1 Tax=Rotaria sordida TaxID=392033 RepID=A0A819JQB3_9BILA|nr:unnamed protein product [Rotaria sordida]CAF3936638.1 unnamed protein product [Rotaria sordida]